MMHEAFGIRAATAILARRGLPPARLPVINMRPVARGRWHEKTGTITLPLWLVDCEPDFVDYYVGHELAHHFLGRPGHDFEFQAMLAWLCPDTWHWESAYKPRLYDRAWKLLECGS